MNKIQGLSGDYAPIKYEGTQIIISYDMQLIDDGKATWYEVYLPAQDYPQLTFADVKAAIEGDINADTDGKILSGLVWTPEGGEPINVWLSQENQFNFKSAYDLAVQKQGATLPVTFKLGEDENGNPVYHTFETMTDAEDFYTHAVAFIHQMLEDGWARKDAIDWEPYQELFPEPTEPQEQETQE